MRAIVSTSMLTDTQEVNIEAWVYYSEDKRYGEDADGNRATKRIFIDEIKDLTAHDVYGKDVVLTEDEREKAIRNLTDKFFMG